MHATYRDIFDEPFDENVVRESAQYYAQTSSSELDENVPPDLVEGVPELQPPQPPHQHRAARDMNHAYADLAHRLLAQIGPRPDFGFNYTRQPFGSIQHALQVMRGMHPLEAVFYVMDEAYLNAYGDETLPPPPMPEWWIRRVIIILKKRGENILTPLEWRKKKVKMKLSLFCFIPLRFLLNL